MGGDVPQKLPRRLPHIVPHGTAACLSVPHAMPHPFLTRFPSAPPPTPPPLLQAVHAGIRVVSWLLRRPKMSGRIQEMEEVLGWLKSMSKQLGNNMVAKPKSNEPEALKQQNKWLDAPQLLQRVETVRLEALQKLKDMDEGIISKLEAAGYVHDALLAVCCFGYMPPMRDNSVLLTLIMPQYVGRCIHKDCQHRANGCLGNRVYLEEATGETAVGWGWGQGGCATAGARDWQAYACAAGMPRAVRHITPNLPHALPQTLPRPHPPLVSPPPDAWCMHVPHHKNTRKWNGQPIKVQLPDEVAQLLRHHVDWGHTLLTRVTKTPNVFVNVSTGAPMKPQEMSEVWSQTVLEGTGVHFGPHTCRSIHVVGTKDLGLQMHPGHAMVMGSSFETIWERIYDKKFNDRQVEAAMAEMPQWREAMRQAAAVPTPPLGGRQDAEEGQEDACHEDAEEGEAEQDEGEDSLPKRQRVV